MKIGKGAGLRALFLLTLYSGAAWGANADKEAVVERTMDQAKLTRAKVDLTALESALKMYRLTVGHYPTEEQGLEALVEKPSIPPIPRRWVQVLQKIPHDPWGREYRLRVRTDEEKTVRFLASQGPDPDTRDDDIERAIEARPAP